MHNFSVAQIMQLLHGMYHLLSRRKELVVYKVYLIEVDFKKYFSDVFIKMGYNCISKILVIMYSSI